MDIKRKRDVKKDVDGVTPSSEERIRKILQPSEAEASKRGQWFDSKRGQWLDSKRGQWLDSKRGQWLDSKRGQWLDN